MVVRVIMELNEKEDFCVFDDTNQTFLQLNCLNKCVLLWLVDENILIRKHLMDSFSR